MASITLHAQINTNKLVGRVQDAVMDARAGTAIHNLLAKMCDPYVPFLEGPLSQTVEVHHDKIRYIQPYARYQYYGTHFNHTLDYHPKATALWDRAMLNEKGEEFNKQVKDILVHTINEGNMKTVEGE